MTDTRTYWLARYILPQEPALRAQLRRWRLPDDLLADDVVQEVYSRLAAMESTEQIVNPRAYFFSVARSIILMHLRHARVVSIRSIGYQDEFNVAADEPSPEETVSDREQLHLLGLAVSTLSQPDRRAFMLRVIDGLSFREVGAKVGVSENAAQKSVARSLVRMMNVLGRGGNVDVGASKPGMAKRVQVRDRDVET